MNTLELKDPIPQIAAGPAALAAPALPAAPQATTPEITPPQTPPRPSGLAAAGFGGVIGTVDVLSAPEEERFGACEAAIQFKFSSNLANREPHEVWRTDCSQL
jgi:hypothetical protein